jgi:hypothetical protein
MQHVGRYEEGVRRRDPGYVIGMVKKYSSAVLATCVMHQRNYRGIEQIWAHVVEDIVNHSWHGILCFL